MNNRKKKQRLAKRFRRLAEAMREYRTMSAGLVRDLDTAIFDCERREKRLVEDLKR